VALLPIVTLGIYHLVWWFRINREMRDYGRAKGYDLGQNPTNSVQGAQRLADKDPLSGWIALILYLLLAPGFWAYLQVALNDVWRTETQPLPGESLPPAADEMPPRLADQPQRADPPEQNPPGPGTTT
jgi:hypothetical protein